MAQWRRQRPDLDGGPIGLIGRFKRLHDRVSDELAHVNTSHGLNAASFDVPATLRRSGRHYQLSPSALIDWTMVTSGTMTNRLDRLEAQTLIERRPNPKGGRGSVVALSVQGFDLIDQMIAEHVENQHMILSGLSTALRERLARLLTLWLSNLGEADIQHNSERKK